MERLSTASEFTIARFENSWTTCALEFNDLFSYQTVLMHGDFIRIGYEPENFQFDYANPPSHVIPRSASVLEPEQRRKAPSNLPPNDSSTSSDTFSRRPRLASNGPTSAWASNLRSGYTPPDFVKSFNFFPGHPVTSLCLRQLTAFPLLFARRLPRHPLPTLRDQPSHDLLFARQPHRHRHPNRAYNFYPRSSRRPNTKPTPAPSPLPLSTRRRT